jgi:hypothetical protein
MSAQPRRLRTWASWVKTVASAIDLALDSAGVTMAIVPTKRGDDFTCDCRAVYRVDWTTTPLPDTDSADCEHCGKRLGAWSETTWPSYTLIKRPR